MSSGFPVLLSDSCWRRRSGKFYPPRVTMMGRSKLLQSYIPQSQSSLVRNPPLSRKTHGFWKASQQLQISWNPCHVYKCEMREAWNGFLSECWKCIIFYVQRHVQLIVILPLNNLHVCLGTKCSNVVAFTPLGCLKSDWPQKSAIKMTQINATTKNCLELQQKSHSTRFHHTGWLKTRDFQWIPFHFFPLK